MISEYSSEYFPNDERQISDRAQTPVTVNLTEANQLMHGSDGNYLHDSVDAMVDAEFREAAAQPVKLFHLIALVVAHSHSTD